MPLLPEWRADLAELPGLTLINQGKVRNTYAIPDHQDKLLVVATDGISIFDFTLGQPIPGKGMILNALTHFWLTMLEQYGFRHHMVATGTDIDAYLPLPLQHNKRLQSQAMVVSSLAMYDYEFIVRNCLTGSGLKSYNADGNICGIPLPSGFEDGDQLPYLLDTPTTKAEVGHDENIPASKIRENFPEATLQSLQIFQIASWYAAAHGIMLADTKFEFGVLHDRIVCLGDEVLTPDSSRFWDYAVWKAGRAKASGRTSPPPFDKQLVRNWGKGLGIDRLDPTNEDHCRQVHDMLIPPELVSAVQQTYRYIFWRLTGQTIEGYCLNEMRVVLPVRDIGKVALVLGSESDLKIITPELIGKVRKRCKARMDIEVHVISCHRNPYELTQFVDRGCDGAKVLIAAGGMALALPGILDSWVAADDHGIPVIGLALGEPHTEAFEAARLSIKSIPGQPVVLDELTGEPYANVAGFDAIISRLVLGELPPPSVRTKKPAQFNIAL